MSSNRRYTRSMGARGARLGLVLLATLLGILLVYHLRRDLVVNVGELGDQPFVSGFYADEADLDYRYRWTTGTSTVTFLGAGSAPPEGLTVRAQAINLGGSPKPKQMTLSVNGRDVDLSSAFPQMDAMARTIRVPVERGQWPGIDPITVGIATTTNNYGGDTRDLGVKIDSVAVRQSKEGLNLPPLEMVFWPLGLVAGIFGLYSLFGRQASTAGALATAAGVIAAIWLSPLLAGAILPWFAVPVLLAGLAVSFRRRTHNWPDRLEALGNPRMASTMLLVALLCYALVALSVIMQSDWIGHADYAENAVVARSLVEGRGLTVDYIAQFYKDYPSVSHPAETWPLLQPLLIAPFFALFGPQTWAAKLPNLLVMLALAWLVFRAASALWDSRVGLLAAVFCLLHPYFFNSVLYPINDLPFTALFFALAWLVWRQLSPWSNAAHARNGAAPKVVRSDVSLRPYVLIGLLAGLLIWSKPSGLPLLAGLLLWSAWTWRRYGSRARPFPLRPLIVVLGVALLVLLPLLARNLITFGTLYFTTESLDAPILRYWNGDQTLWERMYTVYSGRELPHPRWVVGGKFGYSNLLDAIGRNFAWVWQRGVLGSPGEGDYVFGLVPLVGSMLGLAALTRRVASLFSMVGLSLGLYFLFVMLYWHFEGRYFQVAVPWLYMLLAWGLFWVWDRLRASVREHLGRRWGIALVPLAAAALMWPNVDTIMQQREQDARPTGYVATLNWLTANSSSQDVVMTRDPWEVNWHTGRRAVMIPYDDLATIESTARKYGVTMLQLGGPVDRVDEERCPAADAEGPFPTGSRPTLGGLYCGRERPGYKLVFQNGGGTIYRLDATNK
ncbi:MAG TPA: glycosyltransferase family 39 protein [Chloroflexia bacterium]|nr:glycosyltransferase family 39 protein [Chloroflexia bacterium]